MFSISSAETSRRTKVNNACKTLNDLTDKLQTIGFTLKRSLVYLRLIPQCKDKTKGKRHRKVANVKLCKAQSMGRKKNPDWWFAAATMKHVESAILMGKNNVATIDKDDKAHIPLNIPAANKQSPMVMTMWYPVILPDHTLVVSTKQADTIRLCNQRNQRGWLHVQWTNSCCHTIFETWHGRCIFLHERLERYIRWAKNCYV